MRVRIARTKFRINKADGVRARSMTSWLSRGAVAVFCERGWDEVLGVDVSKNLVRADGVTAIIKREGQTSWQ